MSACPCLRAISSICSALMNAAREVSTSISSSSRSSSSSLESSSISLSPSCTCVPSSMIQRMARRPSTLFLSTTALPLRTVPVETTAMLRGPRSTAVALARGRADSSSFCDRNHWAPPATARTRIKASPQTHRRPDCDSLRLMHLLSKSRGLGSSHDADYLRGGSQSPSFGNGLGDIRSPSGWRSVVATHHRLC